jgi:hypothetical protein
MVIIKVSKELKKQRKKIQTRASPYVTFQISNIYDISFFGGRGCTGV